MEALDHARALSKGFRYVASIAAPSVVAIRTEARIGRRARGDNPLKGTPFEDLVPDDAFKDVPEDQQGGAGRIETGLGSGVIIDGVKGIILTNRHVVQSADKIIVRFSDGREVDAIEVKKDTQSDIAVVRIKGSTEYKAAKLGRSSQMEIGDWVVAVGNPFGLETTVTVGIISAKGRGLREAGNVNLLQTDAAINPGNSGGPLFNLGGEVIGINTAIATSNGGFQGVGFAIPIDQARWVAEQLVENGEVRRAYLGVVIQPVDLSVAEKLGVRPNSGVYIAQVVPKAPAAEAGIRVGDVIVEFAGRRLSHPRDLQETVEQLPFGSKHPAMVLREGKEMPVQVAVQPRPTNFAQFVERLNPEPNAEEPAKTEDPKAPTPNRTAGNTFGEYGLTAAELTPEQARELGLQGKGPGVVITAVAPKGAAEEAGLESGMVVLRVGSTRINTLAELEAELAAIPRGKDALLMIRTGRGGSSFVALPHPE